MESSPSRLTVQDRVGDLLISLEHLVFPGVTYSRAGSVSCKAGNRKRQWEVPGWELGYSQANCKSPTDPRGPHSWSSPVSEAGLASSEILARLLIVYWYTNKIRVTEAKQMWGPS